MYRRLSAWVATPCNKPLNCARCFILIQTTRHRVGLEPTSPLFLGFGIEGWDRTTDLKIISFAFYQLNYSDMYQEPKFPPSGMPNFVAGIIGVEPIKNCLL